jgi:hypothetical protein
MFAQQVALSLMTEFENLTIFKPDDYNLAALSEPFSCAQQSRR